MGVLEHKARLHQRILPVERHAFQEHHALGVDVDADVVELQYAVRRAWLRIELEEIAQARASAAPHAQAQSPRDAFALEGFANLLYRLGSNRDHTNKPCL